MQILETGISTNNDKQHRANGFSLIEILVVLVIIGIFLGATVLSINTAGIDRDLEWEAFRVNTLIDVMSEEAIVRNKDFGILFTESSYHFYIYDNIKKIWYMPTDETVLSSHELRNSVTLALSLEDKVIELENSLDLNDQEQISPHIILFSSGLVMPFKLFLNTENSLNRFIVNVNSNSAINLIEDFID